jgi:hypothetical protein
MSGLVSSGVLGVPPWVFCGPEERPKLSAALNAVQVVDRPREPLRPLEALELFCIDALVAGACQRLRQGHRRCG